MQTLDLQQIGAAFQAAKTYGDQYSVLVDLDMKTLIQCRKILQDAKDLVGITMRDESFLSSIQWHIERRGGE